MGLPYMPISWGGARGVNVCIYASSLECTGIYYIGYSATNSFGSFPKVYAAMGEFHDLRRRSAQRVACGKGPMARAPSARQVKICENPIIQFQGQEILCT